MVRGVYAGSFDPLTNGHIDIIRRSFKFCDELVISIGSNTNKKAFFTENQRQSMIEKSLIEFALDALVMRFSGLLVEHAKSLNAKVLIRGIRSVSDFEYEINLANINKTLAPEIETVFLPTSPELAVVSSSMVKEIAKYKGNVSKFVPSSTLPYLISAFPEDLL